MLACIKDLRDKNDGFTLVELLVVVAIILILVAIAIPVFNAQLEKSREATDIADLRQAYAAAKIAQQEGSITTCNANGNAVKTRTFSTKGGIQSATFCYDPATSKFYESFNYSSVAACGKGTAVDGGCKTYGFGKGRYVAAGYDYTKSKIAVYFETDGTVTVFFTKNASSNNALIQNADTTYKNPDVQLR